LSDDDEADIADRKRATIWLAVLLAGAGLCGFLWLWLDWRDGAGIASSGRLYRRLPDIR
jgi:hypothetical protein